MKLIWVGKEKGAEGLPGIPARDLSDEEVKKFGKENLLGTGLYAEPKKEKQEPKERI